MGAIATGYDKDTVLDDADTVIGTDSISGKTKVFTGAVLRAGMATSADLTAHASDTNNPHAVTKTQVGLGNVPNVDASARANQTGTQPSNTISDFNTAVNALITTQRGATNGVASLDGSGLVPSSQLPALNASSTFTVASQAAMLALAAGKGDFCIRSDVTKTFILSALPASTLVNWIEVLAGGGGTGDMVLASSQTNTGPKTYNRATFLDKGSQVFDVKAYGAKGDGATDDFAAITAAITAIEAVRAVLTTSATLYFPDGQFLTSATIVAKTHMHIRGAGRGATTLIKNFNTTPLLDISGSGTSADGSTHIREVSLHDIKLEGNGMTGAVCRIYYASELYFQNVMFVGGNDRGIDAVELFDSYFNQCAWEDFVSTTVPVIHIRSSAAASGFGNGIDSSNMIWFTQCRIESYKYTAIKIEPGLGAGVNGAPNGFFFNQFKSECSNVRAPLIDIDPAVMNFHMDMVYLYAGAFDAGFSTPIDIVNLGAHALVSMNNVFLGAANGIVAHGMTVSSADGVVQIGNIFFGGTAATSVINFTGGAQVLWGRVDTDTTPAKFSGSGDRTSHYDSAVAVHTTDTINNPTALAVINDGSGFDADFQNTAGDANMNVRTSHTGSAAFANLFSKAADFLGFNGYVNDVLVWRVGNGGDAGGVFVYVLDGTLKALGIADDKSIHAFGAATIDGALTQTGPLSAASSVLSSSPTAGMGYKTGAGGVITQATNKSTTVVLNKVCGKITMNAAALAAATTVSFTLTNSAIAVGDVLVLNHVSGGTAGAYALNAQAAAGSASINVRNHTAGSLSEAIVIDFVVVKGVVA